MVSILYTCPTVRSKVQHFIADDDPLAPGQYAGIVCAGCGRIHFVNRDGKVFRAQEPEQIAGR